MKEEKYMIIASNENSKKRFAVMAENHFQHIWNKTTLQGVSKSGAKKLDNLKKQGYSFELETGRGPIIENWEI